MITGMITNSTPTHAAHTEKELLQKEWQRVHQRVAKVEKTRILIEAINISNMK